MDDLVATHAADSSNEANRIGFYGALTAAFGVLGSGPVALLVVAQLHPQPPWLGPEMFARHYHGLQVLPYALGFLLVMGFVALLASLHALASPARRARSAFALLCATVFATLVCFNYAVQTTFVPTLVHNYDSANAALLSSLTMSNPESLGWALEMWGYAFLGLATWLAAGFFTGPGLERAVRWSFVANGPISILAACWTAFRPGWEATDAGLLGFALWNVLAFAMATFAVLVFRARLRGRTRSKRPAASRRTNDALHIEFSP
jgi:hypothetical protein